MRYPMYVVRVVDFMCMTSAQPHQRLVARGLALEHGGRGDVSVFVSHQWCGTRHADPSFRQLGVLQGVFRSAARSSLVVEMDILSAVTYCKRASLWPGDWRDVLSWSMWYDYFSVPQPDALGIGEGEREVALAQLHKAVSSLAVYVETCAHFLILAPTVVHQDGSLLDYLAWKRRGWCRFERMARILRCGDTRVFVIRRLGSVLEVGAQDYVFDPVGTGEFGCETDRVRLAAITQGLISEKLQALYSQRRMTDYRSMLALRAALLEGLPSDHHMVSGPSAPCSSSAQFLAELRSAIRPRSLYAKTALLLATRAGDAGAMQALIGARASLDAEEPRTLPAYCTGRGQRPIHAAAWHGHLAAVELLLQCGVSANARNSPMLSTPLHFAGSTGKREVINVLLAHRAEIDARQDQGLTALEVCICYSRADGVKALLEAGASCASSCVGLSPLHVAAIIGPGEDIVNSLLQARACPHSRYKPRPGSAMYYLCTTCGLSYTLGNRNVFSSLGYHAWDATPLMFAMISGAWLEARVLQEYKADANARNGRGATPASLASFGRDEAEIKWLNTLSARSGRGASSTSLASGRDEAEIKWLNTLSARSGRGAISTSLASGRDEAEVKWLNTSCSGRGPEAA